MKKGFFEQTKGGLIVSCQALADEPLHSSYIMSRMAVAAAEGGARGIRANSTEDIQAIRQTVELPIIGIIKRDIPGCEVYITPAMEDVDALVDAQVDVIALDATSRQRPGGTLTEVFPTIRAKYPEQLFMADCSCFEDAVLAKSLGFDIIGTTLCGYTKQTVGTKIPNFSLLEKLAELDMPIIAEGGIWDPDTLLKVMRMPGVHAAVVGTAITRPREITRRFVAAIT